MLVDHSWWNQWWNQRPQKQLDMIMQAPSVSGPPDIPQQIVWERDLCEDFRILDVAPRPDYDPDGQQRFSLPRWKCEFDDPEDKSIGNVDTIVLLLQSIATEKRYALVLHAWKAVIFVK
ncbi:hypothetical protein PG997_012944 [Apiospora hydei]|uniref:Uncharacterized protein n=1 Tax=Apiospora hydei TaxID=1337664 RepID=A0ABR1V4S6_9PEZI